MVALKKKKNNQKKNLTDERRMLRDINYIRKELKSHEKRQYWQYNSVQNVKSIYNTVPADVMHTVQFSFYIVLVWTPAWSIYWLNTGGKAAILAFSNFNGYSARRVDLEVGVLEKEIENIIAGWSSSVAYCMCYMNVSYDEEQRADERDKGPDGREKKKRGQGWV